MDIKRFGGTTLGNGAERVSGFDIAVGKSQLPVLRKVRYVGLHLEPQAGQSIVSVGLTANLDLVPPISWQMFLQEPAIFALYIAFTNQGVANWSVQGSVAEVDFPGMGLVVPPDLAVVFQNTSGLTLYPVLELYYDTVDVTQVVRDTVVLRRIIGTP